MSWGKANRLARLRGESGFYFLIALDHGISVGPLAGLVDYSVCEQLSQSGISGFVINPGCVSRLPPVTPKAIVIQLMAMPNRSGTDLQKVAICSVLDAVGLAADAVSVQINFADFHSPHVFRELCAIVREADRLALPVLCMVNWGKIPFGPTDLTFVMRVLSDVGVDLVKAPMPNAKRESGDYDEIRTVLRASAPALVSGGPSSSNFIERVSAAAAVGFSGVCLGRNIFQSKEPLADIARVLEVFPRPDGAVSIP
jgi:DhnA family fructose-bisphosphate aldolase class Ia